MQHLEKRGWVPEIRKAAIEDKIPILGICLGMQLLSSKGQEGGETKGLDLIPGTVEKFAPDSPDVRIPHVGWNELVISHPNPLLSGIPNRSDFYFVHSYHFVATYPNDVIATTPYCGSFVSAVARGNIFGTQFHPEKSSKAGFRLLRNFLSL
jgi:glutamine amidotransferase